MSEHPAVHFGLMVNPVPYLGEGGGVIFAEIVPSGASWLRSLRPSVRFWWWEIHRVDAEGEGWTHGYEPGGCGGAYTFRGAVRGAMGGVDEFELGGGGLDAQQLKKLDEIQKRIDAKKPQREDRG